MKLLRNVVKILPACMKTSFKALEDLKLLANRNVTLWPVA